MTTLDDLPTPSILVEHARLARNIDAMQAACDAARIELRPHIKTHKMVAVTRMQLEAGATGITCAKLSEAEALLPSGIQRIFLAHCLVDRRQAPRLAALGERLEELRVAATSFLQVEALNRVAQSAGRRFITMMAIDTGLGREGVRSKAEAQSLARIIARSSHLELGGFYTHEGHVVFLPPDSTTEKFGDAIGRLCDIRDSIDPSLPAWPGCSASAVQAARSGRVQAVRPGTYVFGDLTLARVAHEATAGGPALTILTTVVDRPEPGLALVDAGSKTLSSDRTPEGLHAAVADGRNLQVVRVNEEHGYLRGSEVDSLQVGDRLRLVPAHVCPVVNLASRVVVLRGNEVTDSWTVEARGCVQ